MIAIALYGSIVMVSSPPFLKGGTGNFRVNQKGGIALTYPMKGGTEGKGGTRIIKGGLGLFSPQF